MSLQIRLPIERSTRQLRGIAFVVFALPEAKAQAAQYDGHRILGRRIVVDLDPGAVGGRGQGPRDKPAAAGGNSQEERPSRPSRRLFEGGDGYSEPSRSGNPSPDAGRQRGGGRGFPPGGRRSGADGVDRRDAPGYGNSSRRGGRGGQQPSGRPAVRGRFLDGPEPDRQGPSGDEYNGYRDSGQEYGYRESGSRRASPAPRNSSQERGSDGSRSGEFRGDFEYPQPAKAFDNQRKWAGQSTAMGGDAFEPYDDAAGGGDFDLGDDDDADLTSLSPSLQKRSGKAKAQRKSGKTRRGGGDELQQNRGPAAGSSWGKF